MKKLEGRWFCAEQNAMLEIDSRIVAKEFFPEKIRDLTVKNLFFVFDMKKSCESQM